MVNCTNLVKQCAVFVICQACSHCSIASCFICVPHKESPTNDLCLKGLVTNFKNDWSDPISEMKGPNVLTETWDPWSLNIIKTQGLEWHWNQVSKIGLLAKSKSQYLIGPPKCFECIPIKSFCSRSKAVFPFVLLQNITVLKHLQFALLQR